MKTIIYEITRFKTKELTIDVEELSLAPWDIKAAYFYTTK